MKIIIEIEPDNQNVSKIRGQLNESLENTMFNIIKKDVEDTIEKVASHLITLRVAKLQCVNKICIWSIFKLEDKEVSLMSNFTFFFQNGQPVICLFDGKRYKGIITETREDYIIVNVPEVPSHCMFESDMLYMLCPTDNLGFGCVEDAIDHIQANYRSGNITLQERNWFLSNL